MDLEYVANPSIGAPTIIFVATKYHPRTKYCVRVTGGATVVSSRGSTWLLVENPASAADVDVRVDWSGCPA
jgi:Glycoside hydrolase family 5 C-terminal domain